MCLTDHNEILRTSRQLHSRDMCKISLWSVEYILNQSTSIFCLISNSIEISLVGRGPLDMILFMDMWTMIDSRYTVK